jgi:gag-polypeptide of LTR copia-type
MSDDVSQESSTTAVLIEQITKMMTQMATLQAAAISNPQPVTQVIPLPVTTTKGILHLSLINVKFGSVNYSFWSQAVAMYIHGKERMKHLMGEPILPSITEPSYQKWVTDDVVVKGWLINSLESQLRGSYIRYTTAKDIWKAITTTYYDGDDGVQVYALNRQVMRVKQEGQAIEEYFDELQRLCNNN